MPVVFKRLLQREIIILTGQMFFLIQGISLDMNLPQKKVSKTWYEGPDVGWSWYKDAPLKKDPSLQKPQPKTDGSLPESPRDSAQNHPYTQAMEKVRKDFEEIQAKAILNPNLENVGTMQKAQAIIMDRSTAFEKAWMMASLLSNESYREEIQANPMHRRIYEDKIAGQLEADIRNLAKTHGIFFMFKNDCPYCHQMVPVIQLLKEQYGFNIKAISLDGAPIEGFPDAVKDNGAISKLNPEGIFPTVLLVKPHSGQTIPLARGLMNVSELKQNFQVIIRFLKEQVHAQS